MKKVLLLGGDSDYNLGDTAILHGLCSSLFKTEPDVAITLTSGKPQLRPIPGVVRILPRGVHHGLAQLKAAAEQDLVIVGGGGLFQDDDSRIKMPYWAGRISLLKLANANIVAHSLGAGPLTHTESRLAARVACRLLRSVSVRDGFALESLQACTSRTVTVVPDPAFMLTPAPPAEATTLLRSLGLAAGRPLVGVALRRWFHQRGGFVPHRVRAALNVGLEEGRAEMAALLDDLALSIRRLAQHLDAAVLLLPSYNVGHEGDAFVCRDLASRLTGVEVKTALIEDPALYKAVTGWLTVLISARMHPLILAAGMGTPIVGMAYNGKFAGVFDLLGIPDNLLWINDFQSGSQSERVTLLALRAIQEPVDLSRRSAVLAEHCHRATAALLGETAGGSPL